MIKNRFWPAGLVLMTLLCFGVASVAVSAEKKTSEQVAFEKDVDRLTDLIVQLMPLGEVFESIAKENPEWPAQGNAKKLEKLQLYCLRSELSAAGFRRMKRKDVEVYAASHRANLKSDIQLLESGVSELFGRLVLAGADAERTGVAADSEAIMKSATAAQLESFTRLLSDAKYLELRNLSGLGNSLSTEKTEAENEAAGEAMGEAVAARFLNTAMKTCEVSLTE